MSLYPSLEDMQVHKLVQAQQNAFIQQMTTTASAPMAYPQLAPDSNITANANASAIVDTIASAPPATAALYPGLSDFMGLELTPEMIALNMPEYAHNDRMIPSTVTTSGMIAPLSNQTAGLQRAQVTHGIRDVNVCKGADGKVGLRVKDINNGIFITLVCKDSPAAMVG